MFCTVCLKTFESQENLLRHISIVHAKKTVEYICPICDLGIRWVKNFPNHYEKVHHKKYKEGLELIKTLKTRVIDNKGK